MFNDEIKNKVWEKGIIEEGYDSNVFRKDPCGAWIIKSEYGNQNSKFGWTIDHILPEALGGDDNLLNLRPMHWKNNIVKGDDYPIYKAVVQSKSNDNIQVNIQFTINEKTQARIDELYKR
ncbi:MAG: HNH endonuclease signature motif containing protein [Bacteroidales bacterium]